MPARTDAAPWMGGSLRLRVLAYFLAGGLVLGPLIAGLILFISFQLEERTIERALEHRLEAAIADPEAHLLRPSRRVPNMRVLTSQALESIPVTLFELEDGVHEYGRGQQEWFVALRTLDDGRRIAVVENTDALELRERVSRLTLAGGSLVTVYLSLWLGFRISRRMLQPLERLADSVSGDRDFDASHRVDHGHANDEIGALASALQGYRERIISVLQRERAFSADASHELRNPLAVILSSAELLAERAPEDGTRRAARRIVDAALQMDRTVTTLLLLSREQLLDGHLETVAVTAHVDAVAARVRDEYPSNTLEIHHLAHPVIRSSPHALEVVVGNLVRNALQHSGGKTVRVRVHENRLVIEDDGQGIPDHELPRVFEAGVRGSGAGGNSTGLGLPLAVRICERLGWRLSLNSTPGEGTRAELALVSVPATEAADRASEDF